MSHLLLFEVDDYFFDDINYTCQWDVIFVALKLFAFLWQENLGKQELMSLECTTQVKEMLNWSGNTFPESVLMHV